MDVVLSAPVLNNEKRLNIFERYLTVWVGLCILVGVLIGQRFPALVETMRGWEFGEGSHIGMRLGEILALTWTGVDLFRKTVTVFRSKNGERRTVPVNQTVMALLKEKAKVRQLKTDLVFPSRTGTLIDANHLRRAFRTAMIKAGLQDLHFHDLRHTFATRLVQSGVDLYKVQRLLGHKSPMMTQRYAHHYPESLQDGVEILDRRAHRDTKLTTVSGASDVAVSQVLEKMVGDTGIEPVASSV